MTAHRQLAVRQASATVGRNVAAWRRWQGLSGQALSVAMTARGIPMGHTAVSAVENGQQRVTVDQLVAFAEVLGLTTEQLLRGPNCRVCWDTPPPRLTCQECGAEG